MTSEIAKLVGRRVRIQGAALGVVIEINVDMPYANVMRAILTVAFGSGIGTFHLEDLEFLGFDEGLLDAG
jgi:hypothetical protein